MSEHPRSPFHCAAGLVLFTLTIMIGAALIAPAGLVGTSATSSGGASAFATPPVPSAVAAGDITPPNPSIDDGQSILLTANPSGGSGGDTFQWYEGSGTGDCDLGTSVGAANTYDAVALAASGSPYYYCYVVTDNSSETANSTWDAVTVNAALGANGVTPADPTIDFGQAVTMTTNPVSGTPSYTYDWYWAGSNSGACSSGAALGTSSTQATGSEITGPGTYYYCYVVSDSSLADGGSEAAPSAWNLLTVNSAFTPLAISVAPPMIDSGQSGVLSTTSSFGGGTSPYSCQWQVEPPGGGYTDLGGPAGCSPGDKPTVSTGVLSASGTWTFELRVADSSGTPATATSNAVTVTVNSALGTPTIGPSNPLIDAGQTVTFASTWSGGIPEYTAELFSGSSSTCSADTVPGQTLSSLATGSASFAGVSPGTNTYYCVDVTDSSTGTPLANTMSAANQVKVHSALTAPGAPTPSATALDADQPLTVTGTVPSTGTPTYSWQWLISTNGGAYTDASQCGASASGSGATGGDTETCTIPVNTLTAASSYTFGLKVTDSASTPEKQTSSPSSTVSVSSAFSPGSVSPGSPAVDGGQSITLTANPSGGTTPYGYQWFSSSAKTGSCNAGIALGTSRTQSVSPTTSTYYCYRATDSAHPPVAQSSGWDKLTMNPALAPGSASPASSSIDDGQTIALTANPSGGTPSYNYQWYWSSTNSGACSSGAALGTGLTQVTGPEITGPGSYFYCYLVSDSSQADVGHESGSSAWDLVTVRSALTAPAAPTVSATTLDVDQGLAVTGTVPSTGTATYSWHWLVSIDGGAYAHSTQCSVNSGSGAAAGDTETCTIAASTLTAGGGYAFELKVTDNASAPETQTSPASSTVAAHSVLTAPAKPTPSATALDADQPLTVTGTVPSTGTPTYSWQWLISTNGGAYTDASQCGASASGNGAPGGTKETCTIPGGTLTASTSYTFELKVADSSTAPETKTSTGSSTVTTSSALTAGTPTPLSPTMDIGQTVSLTASATGGTTPYSYQWYASSANTGACDSGTVMGTSGTQLVSPTITRYYCYSVTDSAHSPVTQGSGWDMVTVNSPLTAPNTPTMSATVLDADQPLTVAGTVPSTGTPAYSWKWWVSIDRGAYAYATQCARANGAGASGGAAETCSIAANALTAGDTYAFELEITDNASAPETQTSSASSPVTVHSELTAPDAPSPSTTRLNPIQTLTVTGTISGTGTSTYTWQWLISIGGGAYASATECGASASGSGATGGATETCSIPGDTLTSANSYSFELKITDNASMPETKTSTASSAVTTSTALTAGALTPTSPTIDSGQSVTLSANPSGGSGSYTYQWYSGSTASGCTGLGSPISGATSSVYSASPTISTYYCYVVTDSSPTRGGAASTSSAWDLVTVNSALTAPVAPTPTAATLDVDQGLTLTGTIPSTGTPTYSWQWLISIDGGAYVAATQCVVNGGTGASGGSTERCSIAAGTLTAGDTYSFELRVTDSATSPDTQTSTAISIATVTAPSSFSWFWVYVGIALAATAAVILVALFALRRRRPPTATSPPLQTWEEGPTPPPARPAPAPPVYLEAPVVASRTPPLIPPTKVPSVAVRPAVPPAAPGITELEIDSVMAELEEINAEMLKRNAKKAAGPGPKEETGKDASR